MDDKKGLDDKCNWYGVILRGECSKCDGYNQNCEKRFLGEHPEEVILERYGAVVLS